MNGKQFKSNLVRIVQYEVAQHIRRTTGYDVECYVTSDLDAVIGSWSPDPSVTYHFSIPVVIREEHRPSAVGGAMMSVDPDFNYPKDNSERG